MTDKLAKIMLFNRAPESLLRRVRVKTNDSMILILKIALTVSQILLDLKQFLIINETSRPFIISDNPVVFTNWFLRKYFPHRQSDGMNRSGLQICLPLSPKTALLLHDGSVYMTEHRSGNVHLRKDSDVESINKLQWLNAFKNIYFPPGIDAAYLEELMQIDRTAINQTYMQRFETRDNETFKLTEKDEFDAPSEGVNTELVHISTTKLPADLRLDAVRLRPKPRYVDDGSLGSLVRDRAWVQIIEDFSSAVSEKRISSNDLWDFVERHPKSSQIGTWLRRNVRRAVKRQQS